MQTCYIVDDEPHAINLLAKYIKRTPGITLVGSSSDPLEAAGKLHTINPDIIFLDIDMPKLSGIELSKLVRDKRKIVFTTAHPGYAIEAFADNVVDYILKPITFERFLASIDRFKANATANPPASAEYFFIQSDLKSRMVRVNYEDILYIESLNNYVIIYHKQEKNISYLTLREMQDFLPPSEFSRIHKSFIINDNKIRLIEGNQVFLTDKTAAGLVIGNTYREKFLEKIAARTLRRQN